MKKVRLKYLWEIPAYYKYKELVRKSDGKKCGAYFLSDRLTDTEKQELKDKYSNVDFLLTSPEYAPEIMHDVLVVF